MASDPTRQLTFDLRLRPSRGRGDFYVAPANALAVATLDHAQGWPGGRMLLIGPEGAGKSHLAAIWAEENGAEVVRARLGAEAGQGGAGALCEQSAPALARSAAVVVEDAEAVAGDPAQEAALFHLYNLMAAEGGRLLLTAKTPPRDWGLTLPDLISRMSAMASVRIEPPDDALLSAVLVKLFADRQLAVPPALIPWLVTHMDRSLATARRLVAALDARALAERRAITRPLAAQVLDSLSAPPQDDADAAPRP